MKRSGGREGRVELPAAPLATFELPPRESSGAYVLGEPRFLLQQGLISETEAADAGVTASQGESQVASQDDDETSVASWNGDFGGCIYFTGKSVERCGLSADHIEAMGGEGHIFTGKPSDKNPMTLLVVQASSNWRKGPKYAYAIANVIPIITFEQLKEELDK